MNGRREIKEATNLSEGTLILWPTTAHLAWTVFNGLGYLRVRRNISKKLLRGAPEISVRVRRTPDSEGGL